MSTAVATARPVEGSRRGSEKKRDALAAADTSHSNARVDLSKLETSALRKYRRHFKLVEVGPNSSKEQLLYAVVRHFTSQQLDEHQVIAGFMKAAKRLKT
eukprot:TRINITY_DN15150_c0_g1_i2.p1 TRINITY_DN15150_c0_g1~~TRINITY_DN15150_c0_g1_i2.p1  ORF type:complete len:100 (-),score=1.44 TRINITY_DN15150_c0_g1_i2:197-496(-)